MGLLRFLLVVGIIWLLYRVIQRIRLQINPGKISPEISKMVRCEHCGIYLPREEALLSNDYYYCTQEHQIASSKEQE